MSEEAEFFPNVKFIPNFLRLLGDPAFSIPKGAQWVVIFEDLEKYILPGIKLAIQYDTALRTNNKWQVDAAMNTVLGEDYQKNAGCVFCQGIGIPAEKNVVNTVGIAYGPFLRTSVHTQRDAFSTMRMTFLDTNVSFADNFLRPWAVSTATFGMIGRRRNEVENYRTNIHCYKLGSFASSSVSKSILMKWTFFDACCISVSEEENNYNPSSATVARGAEFIYNSYSVDSSQNIFTDF